MRVCEAARAVTEDNFINPHACVPRVNNVLYSPMPSLYPGEPTMNLPGWRRREGEGEREKTNYFIHHLNNLTTPTTTKPRPQDHTHLQHVDVGPTSTVALVDSDRLFPQQVAGIKKGHLSQLLVGDVAAALR